MIPSFFSEVCIIFLKYETIHKNIFKKYYLDLNHTYGKLVRWIRSVQIMLHDINLCALFYMGYHHITTISTSGATKKKILPLCYVRCAPYLHFAREVHSSSFLKDLCTHMIRLVCTVYLFVLFFLCTHFSCFTTLLCECWGLYLQIYAHTHARIWFDKKKEQNNTGGVKQGYRKQGSGIERRRERKVFSWVSPVSLNQVNHVSLS